MFKNLLPFFALFAIHFSFSQEVNNQFPNEYLGNYKGELRYQTSQGMQKIPMEFTLQKTDSLNKFDYWLVYNNQPRKYTLIVKDSKKGVYEIDENNGIILPARFFEDTLYSWFEVNGNKVSSRLQFSDNKLFFEILFANTKNKTITGGISKEIPEVFGYPISAVQKATLTKED